MGFLPDRSAAEERKSLSVPSEVFHDVTVAPYRYTCTESPEGRVVVTTLLSTDKVGCGIVGDMAIETGLGLFLRSILELEDCK